MSEHTEQKAFFHWTELLEKQYPELSWFFAVPNGGHRKKSVAGKLKAEGVRKGVPDVFNLTRSASFAYRGLVLEFKVGSNTTTSEQREWIAYLQDEGYCVRITRSWLEAALITIEYFGLPESLKKNLPRK